MDRSVSDNIYFRSRRSPRHDLVGTIVYDFFISDVSISQGGKYLWNLRLYLRQHILGVPANDNYGFSV